MLRHISHSISSVLNPWLSDDKPKSAVQTPNLGFSEGDSLKPSVLGVYPLETGPGYPLPIFIGTCGATYRDGQSALGSLKNLDHESSIGIKLSQIAP